METKYVFVTGGVVSAIGKGITTASLGMLLKRRGYRVALLKIDPYLNTDAGLMNPFQHGEVYVTDDRAETDLDLGHYERFVDESMSALSNVTTGQVYAEVIRKERDGGYYLGATIQVIPHVTDEIKERIRRCARHHQADICIVEVGGTVGDIEGQPFLEAIRQMRHDEGRDNVCYVHVTLVPYLSTVGELKTKPTQHSVRELRSMGIQPDVLVCRTQKALSREMRAKIALFCDVPVENVVEARDIQKTLYEIPLALENEGIANLVTRVLRLPDREANLDDWREILRPLLSPSKSVRIAMVGKYMDLHDSYLSVTAVPLVLGLLKLAFRVASGLTLPACVHSRHLPQKVSHRRLMPFTPSNPPRLGFDEVAQNPSAGCPFCGEPLRYSGASRLRLKRGWPLTCLRLLSCCRGDLRSERSERRRLARTDRGGPPATAGATTASPCGGAG